MKVSININKHNTVKFKDLSVGDCFILSSDSDRVYMKVSETWDKIRLNDSVLSSTECHANVYRVSVELNVLEII